MLLERSNSAHSGFVKVPTDLLEHPFIEGESDRIIRGHDPIKIKLIGCAIYPIRARGIDTTTIGTKLRDRTTARGYYGIIYEYILIRIRIKLDDYLGAVK